MPDSHPTFFPETVSSTPGSKKRLGIRPVRLTILLISTFLLLSYPKPALCQTYVSGTITEDTTWSASGNPYVADDVLVDLGVILTIDPGVIVKFAAGGQLYAYGTVSASGTSSQPIHFTSLKDDTIGGDTNGDGSATTPSPGDWSHLHFADSSVNTVLDHVMVRYAGDYSNGAAMESYSPSLTLSNSTIEDNRLVGIGFNSSTAEVTGCFLRNHPSWALGMGVNSDISVNNGECVSWRAIVLILTASNEICSVHAPSSLTASTKPLQVQLFLFS